MNKSYNNRDMRKVVYTFLGLVCLSLIVAPNTQAIMRNRTNHQPNPDQYQEYIYDLKTYYSDRQAYLSAHDQYKAYQTGQSKENALDASKEMLESSRIAMAHYIELLEHNLQEQDAINERVQNSIVTDLNIHLEYLNNSTQTIQELQTLDQVKTTSDALYLRYRYLLITATQALNYIDATAAKHRNDDARMIVNKFQNIVTGFPQDNRSRGIVQKWTDDMNPELAYNDAQIIGYIDGIYPLDTRGNYFESHNGSSSNGTLSQMIIKQKSYLSKFREMSNIAKEAYRSL
jgi:hypothetical protein